MHSAVRHLEDEADELGARQAEESPLSPQQPPLSTSMCSGCGEFVAEVSNPILSFPVPLFCPGCGKSFHRDCLFRHFSEPFSLTSERLPCPDLPRSSVDCCSDESSSDTKLNLHID